MKSSSAPEPAAPLSYRSVCGLAVLSLFLGGLSAVALAYPGAWIIPLPAIVCSLWALRRIRRRPDELLGRRAAWTGLALALFFGAWAPARYATDHWLLNREARQFIEQWLHFTLQGELEVAHQATLDFYLRQPEGTLLREFYQNSPEDLQELQDYFSRGIARDLVGLGHTGEVRFERSLGMYFERDAWYITQRFLLFRAGQDQPVARAQVRVVRQMQEGVVYWILLGLADADRIDEQLGLR